ncbi:MAG: diguanylate cyclase [Bryobacteraceae bacterium]
MSVDTVGVRLLSFCGLPIRLTRSVFRDQAIAMAAFGLFVGLMFPYAVHRMGVPVEHVLTLRFHLYCLAAGLIVAGMNVLIASGVVRARMRLLAGRLEEVRATLERIQTEADPCGCDPEHCFLPVDSEDELGRTSEAFNLMAAALGDALRTNAAVRRLGERLVERLRWQEMASTALDELIDHTLSAGGAVLLVREGQLELAAARGLAAPESLVSHPEVCRVLERQDEARIEIPGGILLDRVLAHFPPRAVLLQAVSHHGRGLGVVLLASDRPYTEEEVRRLRLMSRPLALAFHNALAYDELERVAALDGLTGFYNRRFGLARLREEFARARRAEAPLAVILFDIDRFKNINDTWGHLAGDRVLMFVARQIRLALRQEDVLVRYGGEEFLAALPMAGEEEAAAAAERIRQAVRSVPVAYGRNPIHATLSAGVAAWPQVAAETELQLVDLADAALYMAKRSGRDRVVCRSAILREDAPLQKEESAVRQG